MLLGAFVVETAVWVFATVVITLCVTRVYLNSLFGIVRGKAKGPAAPPRKLGNKRKVPAEFSKGPAAPPRKLSRNFPFVTVLLPTYNENAVIDRLLTATTKMDYPNYELMVADDSTDRDAIKRLESWEKRGVTVVHRDARKGFKAGALNNALARCDARSEYLLLFDADYGPQPDTIWRFLERFE